jgi:hypothetical protein
MAFEFTSSGKVVDESRQITISPSAMFYDDAIDRLYFTYGDTQVRFDFSAVFTEKTLPPMLLHDGSSYTPRQTAACHIEEQSVRWGLQRALGVVGLDEQAYAVIRAAVIEGLFVLITRGGSYRGVAPEFVIDMPPMSSSSMGSS